MAKPKKAKRRGAKPIDPSAPRNAVFSTRLPAGLRAQLEQEAARKRQATGRSHSLSSEIIRRLQVSLDATHSERRILGKPHTTWLARLVAQTAEGCERETRLSWRRDRFTYDAVRTGVIAVLDDLAPKGEATLPKTVADRASRLAERYPEKLASIDYFKSSDGIGLSCAQHVIGDLRLAQRPPGPRSRNLHYGDEYFDMPTAREALGLTEETDE